MNGAQDAVQRHFRQVASTYGDLRRRGPNGWLRRQEQRAVAALGRIEPGAKVLDAGCGDGEILQWATARGARAFGFDLVAEMAATCRARGFDVSVQDMEHLGVRPGFDWVLCIGSLEFTREPQRALDGFSHSLRDRGRLLLLYPRRGWLGAVYAAYHRRHGVLIHLFERAELGARLERAGLQPRAWRDCLLSSVCLAEKLASPR